MNSSEPDLFNDYFQTKILQISEQIVCVFGLISNTLSVLLFLKAKLKDSSYKYMLVTSFSDLIYLSLIMIFLLGGLLYENSYFQQIYSIWIDDYFTSCLAIFSIQIDIVLALQRYLILLNKTCCQKISHNLIMSALFVISLMYYLPVIFFKDVICRSSNQTNLTHCEAVRNQLGSSLFGNLSVILMSAFRFFLVIIVLTSINILNSYKFKKRFKIFHFNRALISNVCRRGALFNAGKQFLNFKN